MPIIGQSQRCLCSREAFGSCDPRPKVGDFYLEESMNSYPKDLVIEACEKLLKDIKLARNEEQLKATTGKRRFGYFGRILTSEEAFARMKPVDQSLYKVAYKHHEDSVRNILEVATHCNGDLVNLTNKEFNKIADWYGMRML
jgi:hypothetical protein